MRISWPLTPFSVVDFALDEALQLAPLQYLVSEAMGCFSRFEVDVHGQDWQVQLLVAHAVLYLLLLDPDQHRFIIVDRLERAIVILDVVVAEKLIESVHALLYLLGVEFFDRLGSIRLLCLLISYYMSQIVFWWRFWQA